MLRLIWGISYNTSTQTTTKIMRLIVFSTKDSLGLTTGTLASLIYLGLPVLLMQLKVYRPSQS